MRRRKVLPVSGRSALAAAVAGALAMAAAPGLAQMPVPCAGAGTCGTNPAANLPFVTSGAASPVVIPGTNQASGVVQASQSAILNWARFDISGGQTFRFTHETGARFSTLNRIWQSDPSVIAGALEGRNGQIYLVNQNGIIFAGGAQVNVGSLVASTLDLPNEVFIDGILANATPASTPVFTAFANGQPSGLVEVQHGAELRTEREGRVMLLAPSVRNNGIIRTPDGQTILAAGETAFVTASADQRLRGLVVEVNNGGSAENLNLGEIIAERGNVTLVGLAVNQLGRVSATTSVNRNGSIMLLARDTVAEVTPPGGTVNVPRGTRNGQVVIGADSMTRVDPDRQSTQTSFDSQPYYASQVEVVGRSIDMRERSAIVAPGGAVSLTAQQGIEYHPAGSAAAESSRIYLAEGARIDVAGERGIPVPIERNLVEVELRGDELKDSPLQRSGILRGKKLYVDARLEKPTPLADVSGYLAQIPRTAGERAATGGSIALKSEGDVVLRQGSALDVSGGSIRYLDGYLRTSKLVSHGRVYDIGAAPADIVYDGIVDAVTWTYGRWGITESFSPRAQGTFTRGYLEGRDAGSIQVSAHGVAFDGALLGRSTAGPLQRGASAPAGGRLQIGEADGTSARPDYRIASLRFGTPAPLAPGFGFGSPLVSGDVVVPLEAFAAGGFNRFSGSANGAVEVGAGVHIVLAPGGRANGAFSLAGSEVIVNGSVTARGGGIALSSADTFDSSLDPADHAVRVGAGARLDASGDWVNDALLAGRPPGVPLALDGGRIALNSSADVVLAPGSLLDASGGGHVTTDGALRPGNAGEIALASGRFGLLFQTQAQASSISLGGELRAYAIAEGGRLTLNTTSIRVGGGATGATGELYLDPAFFGAGGFRDFHLRGTDGLSVAAGVEIAPVPRSFVVDAGYATRPSGSRVSEFARFEVLPAEERTPQALSLRSAGLLSGRVEIGEQAKISVDPGGEIQIGARHQVTLLGHLEAPAGTVTLELDAAADSEYSDTHKIWLGGGSAIDAAGVSRVLTDSQGNRVGDVLRGGEVRLRAARGSIVARTGARIDVSGAGDLVDLPVDGNAGPARVRSTVASDAGSLRLEARESILFDATVVARAGGAGSRGGALGVSLDFTTDAIGYPANPRVVRLQSGGSAAVPAAMLAEGGVPGSLVGTAVIDVDKVRDAGFDSLSVRARDRVDLAPGTSASLRTGILLDSPAIAAAGAGASRLEAAYVRLGNLEATRQALQPASGGGASLAVAARMIDLEGKVALQGFDSVTLTASEDIRGQGRQTGLNGRDLTGTLSVGKDLLLKARQIYPTTFSQFTIQSAQPGGSIVVEPNGAPAPVLSAGGSLTLKAGTIVQGGAIKAPFGAVALEAAQSLTLLAGGLTSVSAEGQLIPFGRTELSGIDHAYALAEGNSVQLAAPPERTVKLSAGSITLAQGATIDVSGGGDLYAYEFVPGPGGSRDVLVAANSPGGFAVLPGLASGFAPRDVQYERESSGSIAPGDQVFLSGGGGLAAGYYTVLPARYALLPGAFLVTPKKGTTDFPASSNRSTALGGALVSGRRLAANLGDAAVGDERTSAFEVRSGATLRLQSEYLETRASQFYAGAAGAQLPRDAGRLSIDARTALVLDGSLLAGRAADGRGAEVDLTATNLAVVAPGGAPLAAPASGSFLQVSADSLNRLNAASLLLGGTRARQAGGLAIDVSAAELVVANTSAHALSAQEILLAAKDGIILAEDSRIAASGEAIAALGIAIGSGGTSAEGALVRVSTGAQAEVTRNGVNADNPGRGILEVRERASLTGRSVILDATRSNSYRGTLGLVGEGALALGANRITIDGRPAGAPAVTGGLVFSNDQLAALGSPADLLLRSYSTLDLLGDAVLGTDGLSTLTIEAAGIGGYAGDGTSVIRAKQIELGNRQAIDFSAAPALPGGTGTLELLADALALGAGDFSIRGFQRGVSVSAQREVAAAGKGSLGIDADLAVASRRITALNGAAYALDLAAGTFRTTALPESADSVLPDAPLGGQLTVTAGRIEHGGRIVLPSGYVKLRAAAADPADGQAPRSLALLDGSSIVAAGRETTIFDVAVPSPGGEVVLAADLGSISMASGAVVDVSGGAGADAGRASLSAPAGIVQLAGTLRTGAAPAGAASAGEAGPRRGEFFLDVGSIADYTALNALLGGAGFTERQEIRVRGGAAGSGNLAIAEDVRIVARQYRLSLDSGRLDLHGDIDASGPKGGAVALVASGDVAIHDTSAIVARGMDAAAAPFGTRGEGGHVLLASAAGSVDVRAGARIDVAGAGAARDGQIVLRALRNAPGGNDLAIALRGTVEGARAVIGEGVWVYGGITTITNGPDSATNLNACSSVIAGACAATGRIFNDAASFVANASANAGGVASRLSASAGAVFKLRPGIEVRSDGDLSVSYNENDALLQRRGWNLGSWRFAGQPGALTLRAAGDLALAGSISDGLAPLGTTAANGRLMQEWFSILPGDSWSYRMVAGADVAAADPLATNLAGTGDFSLKNGKLLRTGNGSIDVVAGGNIELYDSKQFGAGSVIYTVGVPGPAIADFPVPTLGTAIQPLTRVTAQFPAEGGDLRLRAGGAVDAAPSEQLVTAWLQRSGALNADGTIQQNANVAWWPRFDGVRQNPATLIAGGFRQGVGALGGGDVSVEAGGDIRNLSVSTPTNGRLGGAAGTLPDPAKLIVQGGGDIAVRSGGNVLSGVFYADRGTASIVARGEIGQDPARPVSTLIALGDAQAGLRAGGNIRLEGVMDPGVTQQGPRYSASNAGFSAPSRLNNTWFWTYSQDSAVDLTALGSVELLNRAAAVKAAYGVPAPGLAGAAHAQFDATFSAVDAVRLYPGTLVVKALGGDIAVGQDMAMYPAPGGRLGLYAAGSVAIPANFAMSDLEPAAIAQPLAPAQTLNDAAGRLDVGLGPRFHSDPPLHAGDREPARLYAAGGDVSGAVGKVVQLPKQGLIRARHDVIDLSLRGQHLEQNDVTRITAGGDIAFSPVRDPVLGAPQPGSGFINVGGPGRLELIAGGSIDLSTSDGIVTSGNLNNPFMAEGGASITVLAGAEQLALKGIPKFDVGDFLADGLPAASLPAIRLSDAQVLEYVRKVTGDAAITPAEARMRFNALASDQQWPLILNAFFIALRDTGRAANQGEGYERGYAAIAKLFPGGSIRGDISLFFSQVKTEQGGDIVLLAPGGLVNAGLANTGGFSKGASSLGIVTIAGGSVKAFAHGDFLVNQSRVFTLAGGDILIWSSEGDIDAGKGAKTASATPPPLLKVDTLGNVTLDATQSVSGSGIGVLLAREGIAAGDVDLIAPRGEVNAGDAGIRVAGNLTIAALRVVGADNIQVGGLSTGVPAVQSTGAAASLAASAGSAASAATQGAADLARGGGAQDAFRPSFITVRILGFGI